MVMPLAGRVVAAVLGGLLVLASVSSVSGTLIVSRLVRSRLTRWVDRGVDWGYHLAARAVDFRRRDRLLATQAAAILLIQLAAWLTVAYVGFALLLWPFAARGVVSAFIDAGSSLFTLGFAVPTGAVPAVIVFLAAAVPARLCLRGGFLCFNRIARAMGFDIPDEADPKAGISLTYAEFLDAMARMRQVGFPIERTPEEAWPEFVGWRVNYERAAYAVAAAVDSVPALWSGPRRHTEAPIAPIRPGRGRPPK
jgi:hypothetical protein